MFAKKRDAEPSSPSGIEQTKNLRKPRHHFIETTWQTSVTPSVCFVNPPASRLSPFSRSPSASAPTQPSSDWWTPRYCARCRFDSRRGLVHIGPRTRAANAHSFSTRVFGFAEEQHRFEASHRAGWAEFFYGTDQSTCKISRLSGYRELAAHSGHPAILGRNFFNEEQNPRP